VAISLCNVLVELIVGAVWLGIWLDYDMAANCDKELQWWYLFILGGILFGLVCEVGVAISAKIRSETLIQMCKILCTLDQLFELGVMLWGVALAWGTKRYRIDTGGCKVPAMFQKISVMLILWLYVVWAWLEWYVHTESGFDCADRLYSKLRRALRHLGI